MAIKQNKRWTYSISLGKAELELTEDLAIEQYRYMREDVWSRFLAVVSSKPQREESISR